MATAEPVASPTPERVSAWLEADALARPARLQRLRERMERKGVDAYFGVSRENTRYLTGFVLAEGEERTAGQSGRFLITQDEVVVLADSRYTIQAREQSPEARVEPVYRDLPSRWPEVLSALRVPAGRPLTKVAVEAGYVPHATWTSLAEAEPSVELMPAEGWVEELRQVKEPAEVERIAAACHVADAALERLLPQIRPGVTEAELALALEWEMRTSGAEALAFDVACLAGERAALPHGKPGERPVREGQVLLFDFGAQVCGYRSDMTRTLFVGEPDRDELALHRLVQEAQDAALGILREAAERGDRPTNRSVDSLAREVIEAAGYGEHFGHGLGHGIGLATHELPTLGQRVAEEALPAPTVFSVEPGVYLEGRTGVRIEDLVLFDPDAHRLERLTGFSRGPRIVGA